MNRVAFGSVIGTACAALVLMVLLVASSTDRAGATSPPPGSDIFATALDVEPSNPAPNTATTIGGGGADIQAGDIQQLSGNLAIGDEICVELLVDQVPSSPSQVKGGFGIFGVGVDIHWNGEGGSIQTGTDPVLGLVGYKAGDRAVGLTSNCLTDGGDLGNQDDFLYSRDPGSVDGDAAISQVNSAAPLPSDATPRTLSPFRVDNVWSVADNESGPGRLVQYNFRCLNTGSSTLVVDDLPPLGTEGGNTTGVLFASGLGGTYVISTEFEATIFCNTAPGTPGPTTAPPTTPPATTPVGTTPVGTTPPVTSAPATTPATITPTPTPLPSGQTPQPTTPAPTTPTDTPVGQQELMGDTDCNGTIAVRDNQALLRNILGQAPLSTTPPCPAIGDTLPNGELWGDWDCNGSIGVRDNQAALRFILGQSPLSQTPPCTAIGQPVDVA